MKYLKSILLTLVLSFAFIVGAKAEDIDAVVTLDGDNTYDSTLELNMTCNSGELCEFRSVRWYYNTTDDTTNGTEIESVKEYTEDTQYATITHFYVSYDVERELKGKYIYVIATVGATDDSLDPITVTLKTTAERNRTATVDGYVKTVDDLGLTINSKITDEKTVSATFNLLVSGLPENYSSSITDRYTLYFTSGTDLPVLEENGRGCVLPETSTKTEEGFKFVLSALTRSGNVLIDDDYFLAKAFDNVFVVKQHYNSDIGRYYCEIQQTPIKIDKLELPELGSRFKIYLFGKDSDSTDKKGELSVFPLFPNEGYYGDHMIQMVIGELNDVNIINKFAKKDSTALTSLLDYAKNSTSEYVYKFKDNIDTGADISNLVVEDDKYYYIYITYLDTLYREVEDVYIVQGKAGMLVNDVNYGQYDDPVPTPTPEPVIVNPKTGTYISIACIGLVLVIGAAGIIISKKKSKVFTIK